MCFPDSDPLLVHTHVVIPTRTRTPLQRNYSHFFRFLCLVSALNVLVLVMAAIHIIDVAGETTVSAARVELGATDVCAIS